MMHLKGSRVKIMIHVIGVIGLHTHMYIGMLGYLSPLYLFGKAQHSSHQWS